MAINPHGSRGSDTDTIEVPRIPRPKSLAGLRILVVEDDTEQLAMLSEMLSDAGAEVAAVTSAHDAMRALAHHGPDVIVSDINMPHCDGYHFLRMVRARPRAEGGATPAIALTAQATPTDRTRAYLASYQLHLAKPVQRGELFAAIRRVATRSTPAT